MLKTVSTSPIKNGSQTILNGDLIIGTAGRGVDFSSNSNIPGMTSELLDWYEEGTWTPSLGGTATYTNRSGSYTRIGNMVVVSCNLEVNTIGTGSTLSISGLPYISSGSAPSSSGSVSYFYAIATNVFSLAPYVPQAYSEIYFRGVTGAAATNSVTGNVPVFGNAAHVQLTVVYFV